MVRFLVRSLLSCLALVLDSLVLAMLVAWALVTTEIGPDLAGHASLAVMRQACAGETCGHT